MQVEAAEQVRWLNAFKAMLERSILQPASALKIDGCAYHHGGHYFLCPGRLRELASAAPGTSDTPWRLSAEAHERLRRAMLAQRIYCNQLDLPLSLSGRSPFVTRDTAAASFPRDKGLDVLAPAGNARWKAGRRSGSGGSVSAPGAGGRRQGTLSQPGHQAGAGAERDFRDALRRPALPSPRQLARQRPWPEQVCLGKREAGQAQLLRALPGPGASGDPRRRKLRSARRPAAATGPGWDWRRFEGTTVPQLPLEEIDKGWTSIS